MAKASKEQIEFVTSSIRIRAAELGRAKFASVSAEPPKEIRIESEVEVLVKVTGDFFIDYRGGISLKRVDQYGIGSYATALAEGEAAKLHADEVAKQKERYEAYKKEEDKRNANSRKVYDLGERLIEEAKAKMILARREPMEVLEEALAQLEKGE